MEPEVYNQSNFAILKAAYLYYIKNVPQNEIAEKMNISITTVSRLIKKAKEEKIIEFVIRDPYIECMYLEEDLLKAFGLKDVIIAPNDFVSQVDEKGNNAEAIKKLVALEGARYLQRIITEDDVLGITWGTTMYYLIHYLNPCQKVDAAFVTLHGSIACCDHELDVRTLVSRMAMAFGGRNYYLLSEALMSNRKIADSIINEKNTKVVFDMFDNVTIAINGIGSMYPQLSSVLAGKDYLTEEELAGLKKENVFGDIALRFINENGEECVGDLRDRTIAIDLDKFKKINTKITIASDESKAHTILAALKGKLVDVLIIDYALGRAIMELVRKDE
jgi:DNA-binding transcriptional regulator LsrR (DeoR family)